MRMNIEYRMKSIEKIITGSLLAIFFVSTFTFPAEAQTLSYESYIWEYIYPQNITGADDLKIKLEHEVRKILNAGHLAPFRAIYGESAVGYYWYHRYDTIYTLSLAYPYLNPGLQTSIRAYLQSEMSNYPLWSANLLSPQVGTLRNPDELALVELGNFVSAYGNRPKLFALYALWLYAQNTGDWAYIENNWSSIISFYNAYRSETGQFYTSVVGAIGFARMAEQKPNKDYSLRSVVLPDILIGLDNGRNFSQFGVNATNAFLFDSWVFGASAIGSVYQGFQFLDITPEIGRYFSDDAVLKAAVLGNSENDAYSLKRGEYFFPLWYMAQAPAWTTYFGEGSGNPVDTKAMIFSIHAWVLKESGLQLRKYLDVPDALVGDYYYMQNLIRTIEAHGIITWVDLRNGLPILIGDINSDTQVDVLDIQACVNHILGIQDLGSRGDVNGDGSVDVLDVQGIVNIILGR